MSDTRLLDKFELKAYEFTKALREIKNAIGGFSFLLWNAGFFFALGYANCPAWGIWDVVLCYCTWPLALGNMLARGAEAVCK